MNLIKILMGHINVDSGAIWIGDPCYAYGALELIVEKANEIISLHPDKMYACMIEGIYSDTHDGDGIYPVYGYFRLGHSKPVKIEIDFTPD